MWLFNKLFRPSAEAERHPQMLTFVSYSHRDADMVIPIVSLLRTRADAVFHDRDCIEPGQRWRDTLSNAIIAATRILVFWSLNAAASKEVAAEYQLAIDNKKDVVPVLLDETPLHSRLADYQWVDFRPVAAHRESLSRNTGIICGNVYMPPMLRLPPVDAAGLDNTVIAAVGQLRTRLQLA